MSKITQKVFGTDQNPTIYYFVGHAGTISQFLKHIKFLQKNGFRIVAFEYDPLILTAGEPDRLLKVFDELLQAVQNDMSGRKVAGIYGISLGTFLGFNILARTEIKRALFNTGPAKLARIVWETEAFTQAKAMFIKNGFEQKDIDQIWKDLEPPSIAPGLTGKDIICMNSTGDEVVTPPIYRQAITLLKDGGVKIELIESKRFGHRNTIIRNLLRLRFTVAFFGRPQ